MQEREIEPYLLRGVRSDWYVEAYDRTKNGERTFRVDRIRSVTISDETFERREGLQNLSEDREPQGEGGSAQLWCSPDIAARELEKQASASELADGSALVNITYSSERYLESEVIKHRGEAILLAPESLRERVAGRAEQLLGMVRALAASRA